MKSEFGYDETDTSLDCKITINKLNSKSYVFKDNRWNSDIKIKVGTYNVWGIEEFKFSLLDERLPYIIKTLKEQDLDIICIQEASETVINYFSNDEWIKNTYYISEVNECIDWSTRGDQTCITLSKQKPKYQDIYNLVADYNYSLLVSVFDNFVVFNCYLNAGGKFSATKGWEKYHECRCNLLPIIGKLIDRHRGENIILAGDFNMDLDGHENSWPELEELNKLNLNDSWCLDNPGYTEDTDVNTMRWNIKRNKKRFRYDAILYKGNIKSKDPQVFGNKPVFEITPDTFKDVTGKEVDVINENCCVDWFPSDHFGVSVTLIIQ